MAPPSGTNGVIPIQVLQKNPPAQTPRGPKAQAPRLKLVCRRLPPGLTKAEFETCLGDEWKIGAGKIDWLNYRKGKISKDVAKPSRPSRVYIHVTKQDHVLVLDEHIREVAFHDATKSFQDSALVGPPALEYAPYPKLPAGRRKTDARQGTIDQDPEFKEFLESLTAPITKPAAPEVDAQKDEKVKTTPLIEALREKKANKDKPQGKSKGRGETKEGTPDKKVLARSGKEAGPAEKNRNLSKAEKEKAQKEAVKALNKEAASMKAGAGPSTSKTPSAATPASERKRGSVAAAKNILQRDLGLGPVPNRRRGTKREVNPSTATQEAPAQDENSAPSKQKAKEAPAVAAAAATEKPAPASPRKERPSRAERRAYKAGLTEKSNNGKHAAEDPKTSAKAAAPAPTILKKPQAAQAQTPTAPKGASARAAAAEAVATRAASTPAQATPPPRPANPTPQHAAQAPSTPAPKGKQAFLKHANASQGITEPLIEEALKAFGTISNVEIDKRKGFAYVDFTDSEGLAKAIAASPVKVAQGAVQVLERKEKVARRPPFANAPNPRGSAVRGGFGPRGRGGRGGARGGGHVGASAASTDTAAAPPSAPAPVAT